ncbi:MAG: imidazole glycerol phosphate synthase subunit HisH [Pseudomonadota bacterium]|nr:MAG: imidazole glycerol phosphate synthase subunit HisH [Pseudomonadota bacterium]
MSSVALIDYGMGNLHSVAKAIEHAASAGTRVTVTADPAEVARADRVVFPGVGAIRDCIGGMQTLGLDEAVRRAAESRPLLAVCVGMQALMDFSEENDGTSCLGIIPGRVLAFESHMPAPVPGASLKIPHMGWNQVHHVSDHYMWRDIAQDSRFYFVHSYYVEPAGADVIAASTAYPVPFTSAIARDNVFAVQFHPEKSQHDGLQLYANFLAWNI